MAPSSAVNESAEQAPSASCFVIVYRPGPNWVQGRPITEQPLASHRAYQQKLLEAGRVTFAGPFLDAASGGIALLTVSDEAAAAAVLAEDPAIKGGVLAGEIRKWLPLFGNLAESRRAVKNVEVVRRVFSAVERRRDDAVSWDAYEVAYDPDVVIHEADSLQYGGDYAGAGAVPKHGREFMAAWAALQDVEDRSLEPTFIAGDDVVVVLWRQRARNRNTGERLDMPVVSTYSMRGGRIAESRMFYFDAAAVAQFIDRAKGAA